MRIPPLIKVLCCGMLLSASLFCEVLAVEKSAGVKLDASPSALREDDMPLKPKEVARVRIPLQLQTYERVVVSDKNGQKRYQFKPLPLMKHNLRARIERRNHFYVGNWHIETVPEKWDRASRRYEVKLRFYKRYGEGRDLEDYVGKLDAVGQLEGSKMLFDFKGQGVESFKDRMNQPVLDVAIGHQLTIAQQLKQMKATGVAKTVNGKQSTVNSKR